jgi:predicted xylose isomerase-like sugar epimerase
LARKELQMLQKEAKTLSLIPINDSRTIHLEERGNDTIRAMKKQSNLDYDVKCVTI